MVTGRVPYDAETPMAVVLKHINTPLPLPRSINPDLPEAVERVILKTLAKDPGARYQTAIELADDTTRAIGTMSVTGKPSDVKPAWSEPTQPVSQSPAARRRIPVWAWGVIATIGLLIVSGLILMQSGGHASISTQNTLSTTLTDVPVPSSATHVAPTALPTPTNVGGPPPVPPTAPTPALLLPPTQGKSATTCASTDPPQICVRDIQTEQISQVTNDLRFPEIGPYAWSPDGQQLVFPAFPTLGAPPDLFVINADGTDLHPVTPGERFTDTYDQEPTWSPDGDWIAFVHDCSLWLVKPSGADAHVILNMVPGKSCVATPGWSPDGKYIAFMNWTNTMVMLPEIWVLNRDGSDPRIVYRFRSIPKPQFAGQLVWSPDGQQLYWNGENWLLNADGSGEPRVADTEPWWWSPSFWPPWGRK
jgi:WD40-like Beta Propeller Repeat